MTFSLRKCAALLLWVVSIGVASAAGTELAGAICGRMAITVDNLPAANAVKNLKKKCKVCQNKCARGDWHRTENYYCSQVTKFCPDGGTYLEEKNKAAEDANTGGDDATETPSQEDQGDNLASSVRDALVGVQCGLGVQGTAIKARHGDNDAKQLLVAKCAKCAPHCSKDKPSSRVKCQRYNDYCQCEDIDAAVYGPDCNEKDPGHDDCGTCAKLRAKSSQEIDEVCSREDSHAFANCGATCRNCVDYW